jgi:Region found in RelA / SpoT proteins
MSDSLVMRGGWSYFTPSIDCEHDLFVGDVSKYPKLQYSMKEVGRAGESLMNNLYWTEDAKPEILHIFSVVNSYRDSHLFPMRSVRLSILQRMRNLQLGGFTAARPKRLVSIRKKLIRHPGKLDQIQDLAGCRAILDDIAGVRSLVSDCVDRLPHKMVREYNYIDEPKSDGYRCHHLVFRYNGEDEREAFHGRRVELQIRTRLQHSWATAVEAVGLFRNEDMKGGEGDSDWLRLFFLMSLEFAITENCPLPTHVQNRAERLREISVELFNISANMCSPKRSLGTI